LGVLACKRWKASLLLALLLGEQLLWWPALLCLSKRAVTADVPVVAAVVVEIDVSLTTAAIADPSRPATQPTPANMVTRAQFDVNADVLSLADVDWRLGARLRLVYEWSEGLSSSATLLIQGYT
jgi:hypothetical protein